MKKYLSFLVNHFEEILFVPAFMMMLAINFSNVLSRYLLHVSWASTEELGMVGFVYVSFLGAAIATRRRQHLGFTMLSDNAPPKIRIIISTISTVLVVVLMYLMMKYGLRVMGNQLKFNNATPALRIPQAYIMAGVPLGGFCIIVRTLQNYVEDVKGFIEYRKGGKS